MSGHDDELDRLAAALRQQAPAPMPEARAAAMAAAMAAFAREHPAQGTAAQPRPSQDRPQGAGFLTGVLAMLNALTSRNALAATTSVAALCIGVLMIQPVLNDDAPRLGLSDRAPVVPPVAPGLAVRPQAEAPAALPAPEALASTAPAQTAPPTAPPPSETFATLPEPAPGGDADAAIATEMAEPVIVGEAEPEGGAALPRTRSEVPPEAMKRAAPAAAPSFTMAAPAPAADAIALPPPGDREAFANADRNPVKVTAEAPVSTFSVDVDTASWSVIRSSLNRGELPPPEAVRIEEMVNYFPYAWPAPEAGDAAPFRTTVTVAPAPWNAGRSLVTIGIQGRLPAIEDRPALNLVFLVDTSGSMQGPERLGLLKQSLALVLPQLRPEDSVAIVAYAGSAGEVLAPTPATDRAAILGALDRLEAGGSTAGGEGLELAYRTAERMAGEGRIGRILLATDGDFNVGLSDPEGLEAYIARKRETGVYLSVLGFGRGNLQDATMQALAQAGNGTAAFIDTMQEARKVLVDQLSGALFPIADDVKIQVEWNPAQVAEYRLIGYETRALAREDFANDRVDAGEIGAGHAVTAIYEVTSPDSPARLTQDLRYATATAAGASDEWGHLRLRWKAPGEAASRLAETPIRGDDRGVPDEARFAAAIAGMGQLLTGATYLGDWGWDEAIALAVSARGDDPFGYRAEAIGLMRLAQALAAR